jgi:hypothetical protein
MEHVKPSFKKLVGEQSILGRPLSRHIHKTPVDQLGQFTTSTSRVMISLSSMNLSPLFSAEELEKLECNSRARLSWRDRGRSSNYERLQYLTAMSEISAKY